MAGAQREIDEQVIVAVNDEATERLGVSQPFYGPSAVAGRCLERVAGLGDAACSIAGEEVEIVGRS